MKNLRKFIRETLERFLAEIKVKSMEPKAYQEFNLAKETQYGFKTENDNIYYLSIKETKIRTKNKEVLELCGGEIDENNQIRFLAINFFPDDKNPNEESTFSTETNKNEPILILRNIVWLLEEFIKKNPSERNFLFSAEPKRMNLYLNAFQNFENDFHVFQPDFYDELYKYKMALLIKK